MLRRPLGPPGLPQKRPSGPPGRLKSALQESCSVGTPRPRRADSISSHRLGRRGKPAYKPIAGIGSRPPGPVGRLKEREMETYAGMGWLSADTCDFISAWGAEAENYKVFGERRHIIRVSARDWQRLKRDMARRQEWRRAGLGEPPPWPRPYA